MKGLFTVVLALLFAGLNAQNIEVVSRSLNLGTAFENNSSTAQVTVYNPGIYPVDVTDIDLFEFYGNTPFTVSDTAFSLMPQDTQSFIVTFLPEHNLNHSSAIIIRTNSGFGHVAVQLSGQGKYSNAYYNTTENLEEEALKNALKTKLAQGYNSLGYTAARDNMYATIDNNGGAVECVYTGRTANFTTRAGANTNSFNCEHTFPQGFFNQNEPMRSDIHHLFPTDITANGKRGNDPFGVVSNPSWQVGGSKSGGGVFEPRDVHKGTCARSMMYFVIRYQDYSNHFAGQEAILRSWHNAFPPLSAEKSRNNQIATLQTSRNPFVDYPQFEERITSFVSNSVAPSVHSLYYSDDTIRLRPSSGRYEYEFVFYNDGNETVTITNFSLSDTSLHFEPGAVLSMTIPPGWASPVRISYESSNTYLAQLTFDTDIPGQPTQVIPIRSKAGIGVEESALTGKMHIYPNPVSNMLTVAVDGDPVKEVKVYDISGVERNVLLSENHIDMSMLPAGFYLLKVRTESGEIMLEKVIKR